MIPAILYPDAAELPSRLVGAVFYNRWVILDFTGNPFGLVTSYAARGVIGQ